MTNYIGKAKVAEGKFGNYLTANIVLTDIAPENIIEFETKAGEAKKAINLNITKMKEADAYGNEYTITSWKPEKKKEEESQTEVDDLPF